jgi:hypothetical protein
MTLRHILLAGLMIVWAAAGLPNQSLPKEYNQRQFLGPSQQVKVQQVIARSRLHSGGGGSLAGGGLKPGRDLMQVGCGSLQLGNVAATGRPGERGPRQNIVVARDVINVASGCKP